MPQQHTPQPRPSASTPVVVSAPVPVPVAVLLPPPAARPLAPDRAYPDRRWIQRTIGVLVATYTRPGELVATNDPDLYERVAAVADFLDRPTTLLTAHPWLPDQPRHRQPAELILGCLPEPGVDSLAGVTAWMSRARRRLSATGYLIVSVDPFGPTRPEAARSRRYTDHASAVVTGARAAGLIYHQHLIAVHAPLTEPTPTSGFGPDAARPVEAAAAGGPSHARVHTDIFVFAARPSEPPSRHNSDDPRADEGCEVRHG